MSRNIRVSEPSAEMQIKIMRAKDAIASQKPRTVRCPYCRHNSIIVFEDAIFNAATLRERRRIIGRFSARPLPVKEKKQYD